MHLSALLAGLPNPPAPPTSDPAITTVVQDSRAVQPGSLFVARQGGDTDGHRHIPAAVQAGAAAILGTRPAAEIAPLPAHVPYVQVPNTAEALGYLAAARYHYPSRQLIMIGVTGTDGKTTTSNMIYQILKAAGYKVGLISTVNAVIGEQAYDTGLHVTTPDAEAVQAYLAQMVSAGLTHCVLEATSHGLAQGRVNACDFDIAVLTNITHEHLDYHGSLAEYRAAKTRLFESLTTAYAKPGQAKLAVLNADDISYTFLPQHIQVPTAAYSQQQPAPVTASDITSQPSGLTFALHLPNANPLPIHLAIVGQFNVSNALAAATACAIGLQVPAPAIAQGLAALPIIPGRMERITLDHLTDFTTFVDFAHTPNALRQALHAARQLTTQRVIVVFGSAGKRDVDKRTLMGEVAGELADVVIVTAEDPRTESLTGLIAASIAGATSRGKQTELNLFAQPDRATAIQQAVNIAAPGDVVIICGKAHEQSMCFGEIEYPWDDRLATRAALHQRFDLPPVAVPTLPTAQPGWQAQPWA